MFKTTRLAIALSASVGLALPLAVGAEESFAAFEVQEQNGVSYISGGIGLDEREAMNAMANEYNLRISVATKGEGKYLSDAKVTVQDKQGNVVLEDMANGPWFWAKLPSGTYKVTAEIDGKAQTRTVTIGNSGAARLDLYWNEPS